MAQGDLALFNEFFLDLGKATHDLQAAGDTYFLAFVSEAIGSVPQTQTDPQLSDFTEVSGTNYTAGGNACATNSWTIAGAVSTYDVTDPAQWSQHAAGPADIKTAILYNKGKASPPGKAAICRIDMTTDGGTTAISLVNGNISVAFHTSGVFTITRS
jgi:hypothetical protein